MPWARRTRDLRASRSSAPSGHEEGRTTFARAVLSAGIDRGQPDVLLPAINGISTGADVPVANCDWPSGACAYRLASRPVTARSKSAAAHVHQNLVGGARRSYVRAEAAGRRRRRKRGSKIGGSKWQLQLIVSRGEQS